MSPKAEPDSIRLNRYLAMLGAGSRRACDDMIQQGRVMIDGMRVRDPATRVYPGSGRITLDGTPLDKPARPLVLVLNKPIGVVTTVSDPEGRQTVMDLCKRYARNRRLFPVGRLDVNTSGLLLLTNDGMLCYRLTHPRYGISKTYQVRVRGHVDERRLRSLERMSSSGPPRDDRRKNVVLIRALDKESVLRITLHEGRNRQVRRMCESVGLRVVKLRRIRFGPLSIRKLPVGAVRPLEPKELDGLRRIIDPVDR